MHRKMKFAVTAPGQQPLRNCMALIGALLLGAMAASAQTVAQVRNGHFGTPVVAVTYDLERAKTAGIAGGFWLQGGGVNVAVPFYRGLSLAGSFSGAHASNIQPGVNLSKLTYLVGPRYTFGGPHIQIFGEGLFGGTHGFDGIFPVAVGITPTANSYAMQFGGGLDIALRNGFGVRVLELDYEHTALPNNGTSSQNDLRLAFGLCYRFNRK
jgi:hypothetical protein